MGLGKTLARLALPLLILGKVGCSDYSLYEEKIDDELIRFKRNLIGITLIVTKNDGTEIRYHDTYEDLKLDSIDITKDGRTHSYNINSKVWKQILLDGQKQYENYLDKIQKQDSEYISGNLPAESNSASGE